MGVTVTWSVRLNKTKPGFATSSEFVLEGVDLNRTSVGGRSEVGFAQETLLQSGRSGAL